MRGRQAGGGVIGFAAEFTVLCQIYSFSSPLFRLTTAQVYVIMEPKPELSGVRLSGQCSGRGLYQGITQVGPVPAQEAVEVGFFVPHFDCVQLFLNSLQSHFKYSEEDPPMRRATAFLGASVLILSVLFSAAQATQIIYRSPKQMGQESPLVVQGKVASVRSFWNEKQTKIFTETVVAVDETFKGQPVGSVNILQLGGVVDNVKMTVHGALSWKPGEEVLLFLEEQDSQNYRVAGFSQGKFHIERDPATGDPYVSRPALEGTEVLGASGKDGAAPVSRATRVPLRQFVNDALGAK
jgi:hypothetical protein